MKKEQQILNKLAKYNEVQKVELSSEPMKVEFGVIDNIKSASAKLEKASGTVDGEFNAAIKNIQDTLKDSKSKIGNIIDSIDGKLNAYDNASMPLYDSLTAFQKAAKELGMNPNENPIYKEGVKTNDDYASYRKYYEGEVKKLNALYNSLKTSI